MSSIGIERIINEIILITTRKKWSKESIKKLVNIVVLRNVLKLLVKFAVVAQVGKLLRKSTYALEGNNPLGVSCSMIFEQLDKYVESGVILPEETAKVCDKAREIISTERYKLRMGAIDNISNLCFNITCRNNNISELNMKIELCIISEVDRRPRERQVNYAALSSGNEDSNLSQETTSKAALEKYL